MVVMCFLVMVGVPLLGVVAVKSILQTAPTPVLPLRAAPVDTTTPLDILKDRFILGEIDLEEYEARLAHLIRAEQGTT
jgi:uncharacterized membrane protein